MIINNNNNYNNYNNNYNNNNNNNNNNIIPILLRQITRWAVAAEQDKAPMIAILHANYAVGYLYALMDIKEEKEIEKYIKDFSKLKKKIIKIQDEAVKKAIKVCPEYLKNLNKDLVKLGINL